MRILAGLAVLAVTFGQATRSSPLNLISAISLPAVEGRFDHFAVDVAAGRLFVAALGNNTVEVLDLKSGTRLKSLPGFEEPQGIAFAADSKTVAVANGGGTGLQLIDATDFHPVRAVRLGDDADNVRYEPAARRLYVGFGGGAIAAVDATDGSVIAEAKVGGHPESFQLERTGTRIFVNVPSARVVAVIDRITMKVITTWPVIDASANYPMALDEANHRLFVGCRSPAKVLVYDTSGGGLTSSFDAVGDTDDLFYDSARKRLYVSGGDGYLDVFQDQAPGFSRIAHLPTAAGARTSFFVPELNRLYLAVPHRGSQSAEIRVYEIR